MVGVHLRLIQFWLLNLKSIENTAMQGNICLSAFPQNWKTRLRKTKLQRYSLVGLARATGFYFRKDESSPSQLKNLRRTDYREAELTFCMRVVTLKGPFKKPTEM